MPRVEHRVSVTFEGRVQGVGFRAALRDAAARAGLTGFCRNEPDGSVRAEIQGDAAVLDAFLSRFARSAPGRIERMHRADLPPRAHDDGFTILR